MHHGNLMPCNRDMGMLPSFHTTMHKHHWHVQDPCWGSAQVHHKALRMLVQTKPVTHQKYYWPMKKEPRTDFNASWESETVLKNTISIELYSSLTSMNAYIQSNLSQTIEHTVSIQSLSHPTFLKYLSLWQGWRTGEMINVKIKF